MRTKVWVTRGRDRIRIMDLDDSHLVNILNMLERHARDTFDGLPFPSFQGEMAQDHAEEAYCNLLEEGVGYFLPDIYEDLVEEVRYRGISWKSGLAP